MTKVYQSMYSQSTFPLSTSISFCICDHEVKIGFLFWNSLNPLTKYHSAGYSSEYSAGRKFASQIFGWNNTLTYKAETGHYDKKSFDTMAYQWLLKYQISFPLFKVSEPWKFQMCWFCVSAGETHSSNRPFFLSFPTEWKNDSYLT